MCIYNDNNWIGLLGTRDAGRPIANIAQQGNDRMDSWENRTGSNAAWYADINGGGDCRNMIAGYENPNVPLSQSDDLSSWKTNGAC